MQMSGPKTLINVGYDEWVVLLALIQSETMGAVHAVVTAPQLTPVQKTQNIIQQLDFCFQMRTALWLSGCCTNEFCRERIENWQCTECPHCGHPAHPGDLILGDMARQIFEKLVDGANESLYTPDIVLLLRNHKRNMLLKFGTAAGLFMSAEAAAPGALKLS